MLISMSQFFRDTYKFFVSTGKLKRPNSAHLDKKSIENNNHARLDERLIVSNKILVHLETKLSLYHNTMRRVPFLSRALSDSEKSSNNDETDQDAPTIDQKALEAADLADNRGMLSILAEISLKALFSPVNNRKCSDISHHKALLLASRTKNTSSCH